jgi:hypothetical protein
MSEKMVLHQPHGVKPVRISERHLLEDLPIDLRLPLDLGIE